jgi:hypothetical protein
MTRRILAYRVIVTLAKSDLVKTTFYLKREEFDNILAMAKFLYDTKAIPRPTVGTCAKAALFKMFGDLDNLLARAREEAELKAQ